MKKGITFGAFDLFHAGHVLMLQEAKTVCDYLIVWLRARQDLEAFREGFKVKKKS